MVSRISSINSITIQNRPGIDRISPQISCLRSFLCGRDSRDSQNRLDKLCRFSNLDFLKMSRHHWARLYQIRYFLRYRILWSQHAIFVENHNYLKWNTSCFTCWSFHFHKIFPSPFEKFGNLLFLGEIHLPGPWRSESHPSERREKKVPTLSFRVDRFSKKTCVYLYLFYINLFVYIYIYICTKVNLFCSG